jgi:hypothetical protein
MALLRMRNASFLYGTSSVGPLTMDAWPGEHAALTLASEEEAAIVALLAAGIAKASSGYVLIGEYDPRVQSVQCKRIAAFVPHEPISLREAEFARYIAYRAALWNVDARRALTRAAALRERLHTMHEAFAFPLIGALVGMPRLIVLDRPPPAYAAQIFAAVEACAVFTTHTSAAAAQVVGKREGLRITQA